ncbi:MAG: ABC transporter permease [Chloroflexi bacterium]|nr:ABC transporter permease [Chloroflexota bacterium]
MIHAINDTGTLAARALRESLRQPAVEIGSFFIPMFVFAIAASSIGNIAGDALGVENYIGFLVPSIILQSAAGAGGSSGAGMVMDIQNGYFDKLLLTPSSRAALIAYRLVADSLRGMILAISIVSVGLIAGSGMETGIPGFVVLIILAGLFGLSYSGLGLAIALYTGSAQADRVGFLIFFPLLFLSPAITPKETLSGWLEFVSRLNPITYILEGMRDLVLNGWDLASLLAALAAMAGFAALTWSLSAIALRSRTL